MQKPISRLDKLRAELHQADLALKRARERNPEYKGIYLDGQRYAERRLRSAEEEAPKGAAR